MAFEKGKNKTGGRKKGVENTDKRKIREAINTLLDNTDIEDLYNSQKTPREKASLLLGLLEFSIPKLQRSDVDVTTDGEKINIISLGKGIKPK